MTKSDLWALIGSLTGGLVIAPVVASVAKSLYVPYATSDREMWLVFEVVTAATFVLAVPALFFLFRRLFRDQASTWALVGSVPCALVIAPLAGKVIEGLYAPYATSDWDAYVLFERVTVATFFLAVPAGFFLLRRLTAGPSRQ